MGADADREGLLRAVLESPWDDTPRLIFADWCEENGREGRAEFIRAGLAKAALAKAALGQSRCRESFPSKVTRGCGACAFCRLELACERHHEDPALWSRIIGAELPFGYSHTSHEPDRRVDPARGPLLFTSRGWVGEIRLPLLWFTAMVAGDLFRLHPVTRVVLTDVRPDTTDRGPGSRDYYFWPNRGRLGFLTDPGHLVAGPASSRGTAEECRDDLSRACVNWGRSLAGLPPLAKGATP